MFCLLVFFIVGISCHEKVRELTLDERYSQIDKISSLAHCKGPNGAYTTKVLSKKDGSLFFSQVFEYRDSPFRAELYPGNKGYVLDSVNNVSDTLSGVAIAMIRSHDFHRMQTNPKAFYTDITFEKIAENEMELFSAVDVLQNPVKIYYDREREQIRMVEFLNMADTTEVIRVEYKKWIESAYGKLAKEVEIVQAAKDTFNFQFENLKINE